MSVNIKVSGGENVTTEVAAQVQLLTELRDSLLGKATFANAKPNKIVEGYSAYVGQKLIKGTLDISGIIDFLKIGFANVAVDTINFPTRTLAQDKIINHSLGKVPAIMFIFADQTKISELANYDIVFGMSFANLFKNVTEGIAISHKPLIIRYDSDISIHLNSCFSSPTKTTVTFYNMGSAYPSYLKANTNYYLVTLA